MLIFFCLLWFEANHSFSFCFCRILFWEITSYRTKEEQQEWLQAMQRPLFQLCLLYNPNIARLASTYERLLIFWTPFFFILDISQVWKLNFHVLRIDLIDPDEMFSTMSILSGYMFIVSFNKVGQCDCLSFPFFHVQEGDYYFFLNVNFTLTSENCFLPIYLVVTFLLPIGVALQNQMHEAIYFAK